MESLKEFKYFNPNTKAPIPDPDVNLRFEKGKPIWRNRNGRTAGNPKWWVAAETKGEQNNLSNFSDSKWLSIDQVLTTAQANNLEKAAKERSAAEAAAAEKKSAKATAKKEEEDAKQKDAEARKKATQDMEAIIKNLSDSGTLQSETMKAVINADNIPIFAKDFNRIKKGIETVVGKATKAGLFKKGYAVNEGEPIENGEANAKSAQDIAADLIKNYLVSAQDESGKAIFNYSVLPVDSDMSESILGKYDRLVEDTPAAQASESSSSADAQPSKPAAEQPAKATSETAPANQSTTEQTVATPEAGSSAEAPITEQSNTITLGKDSIEELTSKLAAAIEPLLEETNKTITSSAKTIKFTCTPVAASKQSADSSREAEQPTESSQETGQVTESKNVYVFRRLLEDEEPAAEQAAPDTQEATTEKAAPAEEPSEESSSEENKEETTDKNKASETPTLPSNDGLKKIIDGLNKVGNTFETPNATYKLSFTMDNMDTKNGSFDIIVTSTSTTPKEGFWKNFWKEFGDYAKKAGLDIAHNLAGERGVMTV